jgi:pectin methylesterase-like acyl-CoA thioesterase
MTNLDVFDANINKLGIGDYFVGIGSIAAQGSLFLAKTNNLTTAWVGNYATPYSVTMTNAIQLGEGSSSTLGGINALFLGLTNAIFTDSIGVGGIKAGGSASSPHLVAFAPVFTNASPTAYFRGIGGGTSRVTYWGVGDTAVSGSSSASCFGKVDFSNGSINAWVNTLVLGRDRNGNATDTDNGVFTFTAGNVNVNTLIVGDQASASTGCVATGTLNVNGASAFLTVNNTLALGQTTLTVSPATSASGVLNIINGTVNASNITVGAVSVNNIITMTNATLIVTNSLATNASGLFALTMSNSFLGLTVAASGSRAALVQTLTTTGPTNVIEINNSTPVIFSVYPQQFPLVKYTTWNGSNTFGLAGIPVWAPGATLVSNGPNASLDLLLPNSPLPVITSEPAGYSGNPGDTVTFAVGISAASVTPLGYQWYNGATPLSDGATGNGSTITGSLTDSLAIASAQPGDNGNYTVVITNVYGSVTSSPAAVLTISAGAVPPAITGPIPANQTAVVGSSITFAASVSGNPAPTLQWQYDGVNLTDGPTGRGDSVAGSLGNALTVSNLQYPASQGTYSIIASNSAGLATNSVVLTVIVPPVITNQPVSLVVTNSQSASFTVVAGGVPAPGYQWFKNNSANPIAGATDATFTIPSTAPSDSATYFVVVTNAAGSVTSSNVTLSVNSTMAVVALAPANAATRVCYDTPLYITFNQAPSWRKSGQIRIYNVTNSATPVDTLAISNNAANGTQARSLFPGDSQAFNYYPVIITGNTAAIYPHSGVMTSNQTYYVQVDDGVFADAAGAYFAGIAATDTWQFTTKTGGPVSPLNPVVAADGSGDFATVQGAVDSIPLNNSTYTLINIQNGNYVEIVDISSKNDVTFRGQSRTGVVVGYPNNINIAAGGGTTHARMAFKVNSKNIGIENLTISNSTPQGGGQAEALMIESGASRFILNNAEVDSRQDTILANINSSQGYFYNSLIQGNYDYIWGGGNLFFTNCEIRTITGENIGNLTAARTDNGATGNWPGYSGLLVSNGFSFVSCQLTRQNSTVTNCSMADANGSANGNAVWIDCSIDMGCYVNPIAAAAGSQLLWEYGNSNLTDTVLLDNTGEPFLGCTQLNNGDPRLLAASSAPNWLNGWQPQLAPNLLTEPTNEVVMAGQTATFTVAATGVPDPTYQWLQNGTNAPYPGANSATLTIPNAQAADASSLSVLVSNGAGMVTTTPVTLTVITPAAPSLSGVAVNGSGGVQFTLSGTAGFGYRVWATTDLTLSPITATWTLLSSNVFGASPVTFTDTEATNFPQRFYTVTVP